MGAPAPQHTELSAKITRLVQERGWNQEDFARISNLNRNTVRQILHSHGRSLRNATVQACARALGLSVAELRSLPLERLLPRMRGQAPLEGDEKLKRLLDQVSQPELLAWLKRNDERARQLSPSEIEELLSMQGEGGSIQTMGVGRVIEMLERRRELLDKVRAIAGTEYLSLLEQFVDLLHEKIRVEHS